MTDNYKFEWKTILIIAGIFAVIRWVIFGFVFLSFYSGLFFIRGLTSKITRQSFYGGNYSSIIFFIFVFLAIAIAVPVLIGYLTGKRVSERKVIQGGLAGLFFSLFSFSLWSIPFTFGLGCLGGFFASKRNSRDIKEEKPVVQKARQKPQKKIANVSAKYPNICKKCDTANVKSNVFCKKCGEPLK